MAARAVLVVREGLAVEVVRAAAALLLVINQVVLEVPREVLVVKAASVVLSLEPQVPEVAAALVVQAELAATGVWQRLVVTVVRLVQVVMGAMVAPAVLMRTSPTAEAATVVREALVDMQVRPLTAEQLTQAHRVGVELVFQVATVAMAAVVAPT